MYKMYLVGYTLFRSFAFFVKHVQITCYGEEGLLSPVHMFHCRTSPTDFD